MFNKELSSAHVCKVDVNNMIYAPIGYCQLFSEYDMIVLPEFSL